MSLLLEDFPPPQPPPSDPQHDAILWWILTMCAAGLAVGVVTWFAKGGGW